MRVDVVVVPGPLPKIAVLAASFPGLAEVVRAEDRAVRGFDDGVDASRLRGRRGDADLAEHSARKAFVPAELRPRIAAVVRAEEPAARAAGDELPWPPDRLPERRVDDPRIVRVDRQIGSTGLLAAVEDLLPCLPAVAGAE